MRGVGMRVLFSGTVRRNSYPLEKACGTLGQATWAQGSALSNTALEEFFMKFVNDPID
jgi:hypothetical protein